MPSAGRRPWLGRLTQAWLAALVTLVATAAHAENTGLPFVQNFTHTEYGGAIQNWAITQDLRGVMYIGNGDNAVLEYDGARWRRIPIPNQTIVRSLARDSQGRIFVGAIGDFGVLTPNTSGTLQFVSLAERLPASERDFADVWRIIPRPEGVYFATNRRIIRVSDTTTRSWTAAHPFHLLHEAYGRLFTREIGVGLLELRDDAWTPLAGTQGLADEKVYAIVPWPAPPASAAAAAPDDHQRLLIGTRTQGWLLHTGSSLQPFPMEAASPLQEALIYGAAWLRDGTLAVATIRNGLFIFDKNGKLLQQLNESTGLINQTIFAFFEDRQGSLWLALDNGLARVELSNPLTQFSRDSGLSGAVLTVHRHAGVLYVGTTQGLFRLDPGSAGTAPFKLIPEVVGQVWDLMSIDGTLLAAAMLGTYALEQGEWRLVRPSERTNFCLLRSRADPERVFIGQQSGLAQLRRTPTGWQDEGELIKIADEIRTLALAPDHALWLGTVATGLIRLAAEPDPAAPAPGITRFDVDRGLPTPTSASVFILNGALRFGTGAGIYQLDPSGQRLIPDAALTIEPTATTHEVPIASADTQGRIWAFSEVGGAETDEKLTGVFMPTAQGGYAWTSTHLRSLKNITITAIYPEPNGTIWFGGDTGLFRLSAPSPPPPPPPIPTLLRRVTAKRSGLLFDGAGPQPTPTLASDDNHLRFEFALPSFTTRPRSFQVRLEGTDAAWSAWSTESYRDYTNLPHGHYRLHVRGRDAMGRTTTPASFDFRILAAWYATPFAYLTYLLAAIAAVYGAARWRSARLAARNAELAALVAAQTQALSDANRTLAELSLTDALTGLRNRRYLMETVPVEAASVLRARHAAARHPEPTPTPALAFILLDLDYFKDVNDRHGHAAGDHVLRQLAHILTATCRDSDTAIRWGGEEFLILARQTPIEGGAVLAERLREAIATHAFTLPGGDIIRCTASLGVAVFPALPDDATRLSWEASIQLADLAVYEAKARGRNTWVAVGPPAGPLPPDVDLSDLGNLTRNGLLPLTTRSQT